MTFDWLIIGTLNDGKNVLQLIIKLIKVQSQIWKIVLIFYFKKIIITTIFDLCVMN